MNMTLNENYMYILCVLPELNVTYTYLYMHSTVKGTIASIDRMLCNENIIFFILGFMSIGFETENLLSISNIFCSSLKKKRVEMSSESLV